MYILERRNDVSNSSLCERGEKKAWYLSYPGLGVPSHRSDRGHRCVGNWRACCRGFFKAFCIGNSLGCYWARREILVAASGSAAYGTTKRQCKQITSPPIREPRSVKEF